MGSGGLGISATANLARGRYQLPLCRSPETMGRGHLETSVTAAFAGPHFQLLLCRPHQTMGRGILGPQPLQNVQVTGLGCYYTDRFTPWTGRILAS